MKAPLQDSSFTLDVTGIAGFFGGDEAISAMASVHMYRGRQWLGWYNSPGSYTVAKKYGRLAKSRFWDGLFPGGNDDPANLLDLDGKRGPRYWGLLSGTILSKTSHVGYVFAQYCRDYAPPPAQLYRKDPSRSANPMRVITAELPGIHDPTNLPVKLDTRFFEADPRLPTSISVYFIALIPIVFSIGASIVCALFEDWYAFSMIMLGVICNGICCYIIGSGSFVYQRPRPSPHSPPADGIVFDDDQIILLKGSEDAVNSILKAKFRLKYSSQDHNDIGVASIALTIQFLLQLFLIPQGGLLGQLLFLATLIVSWLYNAYLSSMDRLRMQQQMMLRTFEPSHIPLRTFDLKNRTAGTVFIMLTALPPHILLKPRQHEHDLPMTILDDLLPNNTLVWSKWKSFVRRQLEALRANPHDLQQWQRGYPLGVEAAQLRRLFVAELADYELVDSRPDERALLETLLKDAREGYERFLEFYDIPVLGHSPSKT
ncbi:hypothetical protein HGRIS_014320 [Hohenbuehelia grisea]